MANVKFFIDGRELEGSDSETILNIARANNIFIPAICYLNRCSPTLACRICLVEADGKQVFACNAKPKEGMQIVTNSDEIKEERKAIMQVYDINHPLECGVCDKSGECELQNYTMEMGVDHQAYSVPDCARPIKKWGLIKYDASLCIVCERCTTVCKDMVGDNALGTTPRGGAEIDKAFKESTPKNAFTIWTRMQKNIIGTKSGNPDVLDCTMCGECIAVCPVGALTSPAFTYKSNAWELRQIPSSCAHCSSACHLYYETKHTSIENAEEKIYRVRNEWNFQSLCAAGRFGFDFDNKAKKCEKAFEKALGALKSARTIKFNSYITNEEAKILQNIKEKLGVKLVNKDAYEFKRFMDAYSSVSGKSLYSANLTDVKNSDAIIVLGSMITTDNPMARYALNEASKKRNAKVVYLHPIEDSLLAPNVNKFVKYEPKSEEGVIALLASIFTDKNMLNDEQRAFFAELDMGYVSSEASFDEAEQEEIAKMFARAKNKTLILGSDLYSHPRAENIAKLAALFEKASGFKVLIIPSQTNTLGVSMICDLDKEAEGFTVGYNEEGDFVLTSLGSEGRDNALDMPALNQQEGTFVNIDKRVVPLNAAIGFDGYELNDLANALGIKKELTVDYTRELPTSKGFKGIPFDDLPNRFLNDGTEDRGYILETKEVEISGKIEEVASLEEMNGTLIYVSAPVMQFNASTAKCSQIREDADILYIGKAAAEANGLTTGDYVTVKVGNNSARYQIKLDDKISSNIALAGAYTPSNPMFEALSVGYKFKRTEIIKG